MIPLVLCNWQSHTNGPGVPWWEGGVSVSKLGIDLEGYGHPGRPPSGADTLTGTMSLAKLPVRQGKSLESYSEDLALSPNLFFRPDSNDPQEPGQSC